MISFAARCGLAGYAREAAAEEMLRSVRGRKLQRVRVAWCDTHGVLRGKTLSTDALHDALDSGVSMVGTMLLKDTSDRTAWPVFDASIGDELPGFEGAANLMLMPEPLSFTVLPWAEDTGWMQAQAWFCDARPVPYDTRRVLQRALQRLREAGYGLRCGLEVEFHVYRIVDERLDPARAAWPHEPPEVRMLHPGYHLLSEEWGDMAEAALRIVQDTARGLRLPLRSLEIELGPSQFEAVFDAQEAMAAADAMVLFRNGVRMALRRAGYHASFVCRPPFDQVMSSGWHLHHSLVDVDSGRNAFMRDESLPQAPAGDARQALSDVGAHWLAGLLDHARALTALCAPTINAYARFRPNALAPQSAVWGRDNRGAMLRVVGGPGDGATRIENRLGEPSANPYLLMAAHVHAGLDGLQRRLAPPIAAAAPYDPSAPRLPTDLSTALEALEADAALREGFGADVVAWFARLKRSEVARHAAAEDKAQWERREYFGRL